MPAEEDISAIRTANFRNFGKFMNKYGREIAPKTGAAGFYAGAWVTHSRSLTVDDKLLKDGYEKNFGTLMKRAYKVLDERNKTRKSLGLQKIETVNDVVKAIRKYPLIVGTQGKDFNRRLKCRSLLEYANLASNKKNMLLPDVPLKRDIVWKTMSHWYAKGAKGEIHIMEGLMADEESGTYSNLSDLKIFVNTELPALLKNPDISDGAKREANLLAEKYVKLLERDNKELTQNAKLAIRKLRSGARHR